MAWPPGSGAKEGRHGGREAAPQRAGARGHEEARKGEKREERNAGIEHLERVGEFLSMVNRLLS